MSPSDHEFDLLLSGLRDVELPAASLDAVRDGVRRRIVSDRRRRRSPWWAMAAAAAVLIGVLAIPRNPALQTLAVAARTPNVPALAWAGTARPAPVARVRPRPAARETETQFIHIVTDDPDVVILWAMDLKGETR